MAFKTITIKTGVYRELLRVKTGKESFSSLFTRLLHETHTPLREFYGAWTAEKGEEKNAEQAMRDFRRELEQDFRRHHERTRQ